MVNGFDLGFVIKQIFTIIYKKIDLVKIALILYIDSYLLYYKYLIYLRIIIEKQLITIIIALNNFMKDKKLMKLNRSIIKIIQLI